MAGRYHEAGQERLADAVLLYKQNQFSGASYLAGCAIEATLWAFLPEAERIGRRGRHDLQTLFEVGLGAKLYAKQYKGGTAPDTTGLQKFQDLSREISKYITDATLRWNNSYRYYPDSTLRAIVRKNRLYDVTASGDALKSSVNILLEACQFFVALGIRKQSWVQ